MTRTAAASAAAAASARMPTGTAVVMSHGGLGSSVAPRDADAAVLRVKLKHTTELLEARTLALRQSDEVLGEAKACVTRFEEETRALKAELAALRAAREEDASVLRSNEATLNELREVCARQAAECVAAKERQVELVSAHEQLALLRPQFAEQTSKLDEVTSRLLGLIAKQATQERDVQGAQRERDEAVRELELVRERAAEDAQTLQQRLDDAAERAMQAERAARTTVEALERERASTASLQRAVDELKGVVQDRDADIARLNTIHQNDQGLLLAAHDELADAKVRAAWRARRWWCECDCGEEVGRGV